MATKFELCTRAAIKLDANAVQSFNEQTREAEVFGNLYAGIKESELSNHHWNFNIAFVQLSREANTPTDVRWDYSYLPPANLLRYVTILDDQGNQVAYEDRSGRVFSDSATAFAKYARDIDETDFPAYFQDALVARLAAEASEALSGDNSVIERAWNEYANKRKNAARIDAQNNPPIRLLNRFNSPWTAAREGDLWTYSV